MTVSEKKQHLTNVCSKYWITLLRESESVIEVARLKLRCNSWLCPTCRKKKARKFSLAVKQYFEGDRVSILTLTDGHEGTLYESYTNISRNWNLLRTHITKRFGKVRFVKVLEPQGKSGYAHLHVLVNKYLPPGFLKKYIPLSGFGRIYDIKEVSDEGAFYYVRKYLRKEWKHEEALQAIIDLNMRRCSGSRGFSLSSHSVDKWTCVDFKCTPDRASEYVRAVMQSHYPYYWEVHEHQNFEGWERYRLEYHVEDAHCTPDKFRDAIRDDFLVQYYHSFSDSDF